MAKPLILYSTNTWLAFRIAEFYYRNIHYAWCSPYFDAGALSHYSAAQVPPTSSPGEIYRTLIKATRNQDKHCPKINQNKIGILAGARSKKEAGVITEEREREIQAIVNNAETSDFKPLLYLIPFGRVARKARLAPTEKRANPFSIEYIIEDLPRAFFDIIEMDWS